MAIGNKINVHKMKFQINCFLTETSRGPNQEKNALGGETYILLGSYRVGWGGGGDVWGGNR